MTKDAKKLKNDFECAVHAYMMAFCTKHDYHYDPSDWVGGEKGIGTIVLVGDMYFNFDDIRYDIDTDQPKDQIVKWYDYSYELSLLGENTHNVNYEHWCMGFRPYSPEQIEKMKHQKSKIQRMKDDLEKMAKETQNAGSF